MALTFTEKRFYQKQAATSRNSLKKGDLAFIEKRAAQKQWKEALAKLRGDKAETLDGGKPEKTMYQRLVDGEFNSLQWKKYYEKLKEISQNESVALADELNEVIKYLEAWYDSATDSMKKQAA